MPYVTVYMCDECLDRKASSWKHSFIMNRHVGLCADCDTYMWSAAKKESEKYSEFREASYESRIFERDGSCLIFDSYIDILARKCDLREKASQYPMPMPKEASQVPVPTSMDDSD